MSDQRSLFDVERTQPVACPVPGCGAIRYPTQNRVITCDIDRERITEYVTRPAACLNFPRPQHTDIPF